MRFNSKFFFTFLTLFFTLYADKNATFALPLPKPAAKVEAVVPRSAPKVAYQDEQEDNIMALRDFMDNVQHLGGSPYGRALMRRTMPVASSDNVAMPSQLKASSSGFIFLPVVGAAPSSFSSSLSGSDGNSKSTAAPIRQTMFINIEAPDGGQVTKLDMNSDDKKDKPCDDDKDKSKKKKGGKNPDQQDPFDDGNGGQGLDPSLNGNPSDGSALGPDPNQLPQGGPGPDPSLGSQGPPGPYGGQQYPGQSSQFGQGPDSSKGGPIDAGQGPNPSQKGGPDGSGAFRNAGGLGGIADDGSMDGTGSGGPPPPLPSGGSSNSPSTKSGPDDSLMDDGSLSGVPAATPKTTLQAPNGIDESTKTKVVFKPLSDPDPSAGTLSPSNGPPAGSSPPPPPPAGSPPSGSSPSPPSGSPPSGPSGSNLSSLDNNAPPAPPAPGANLANTGAVPDNADDKKPNQKLGVGMDEQQIDQQQQQLDDAQGNSPMPGSMPTMPPSGPGSVPMNPPSDVSMNASTLPPSGIQGSTQSLNGNGPNPASMPASSSPTSGTLTGPIGGSNKDYFIYPVEQNDKLVDLKKGDMVAYVDKNGNVSGGGNGPSTQSFDQMLGGNGDGNGAQNLPPPPAGLQANGQPPMNPTSSQQSSPPVKRTHPRMWNLVRRADKVNKSPLKAMKRDINQPATRPGFNLWLGKRDAEIRYHGQPPIPRRAYRSQR